jgi:hypothetical protein
MNQQTEVQKLQQDLKVVDEAIVNHNKVGEVLKNSKDDVKKRLLHARKEEFRNKWNKPCETVIDFYMKLLNLCSVAGNNNIPFIVPTAHGQFVTLSIGTDKYDLCVPKNDSIRDAFEIMYGEIFVVPENNFKN